MRRHRLLDTLAAGLAACLVTLVVLTPARGLAQEQEPEPSPQQVDLKDEEARQLFEAARLAFQDGRFEDALRSFRRAYELSDRPGLLYNIGTAADRLRRDGEAIEAFESYLEQAPDAPNRGEVERRLEVLRSQRQTETETGTGTEAETGTEAPTPEQTAAAAVAEEPGASAPAAPPSDEDEGGIASQWWFWTIVGVVVLGGAGAGLGIALAGGGGGGIQDTDWTTSALRGSR